MLEGVQGKEFDMKIEADLLCMKKVKVVQMKAYTREGRKLLKIS